MIAHNWTPTSFLSLLQAYVAWVNSQLRKKEGYKLVTDLRADLLPYNQAVLDHIRAARDQGQRQRVTDPPGDAVAQDRPSRAVAGRQRRHRRDMIGLERVLHADQETEQQYAADGEIDFHETLPSPTRAFPLSAKRKARKRRMPVVVSAPVTGQYPDQYPAGPDFNRQAERVTP